MACSMILCGEQYHKFYIMSTLWQGKPAPCRTPVVCWIKNDHGRRRLQNRMTRSPFWPIELHMQSCSLMSNSISVLMAQFKRQSCSTWTSKANLIIHHTRYACEEQALGPNVSVSMFGVLCNYRPTIKFYELIVYGSLN